MSIKLWLRSEVSPDERRTPLIPLHAAFLVQLGHRIWVEKSDKRIYPDSEYEKAGCLLVKSQSWHEADADCYIIGLRGLPEANFPIQHAHIFYSYALENYNDPVLERFRQGGGKIYDYLYLIDCMNSPVITKVFSFWGGYCAGMMALMLWDNKINHQNSFEIVNMEYAPALWEKKMLNKIKKWKTYPHALVIGGNGQAGSSIVRLLKKMKINVTSKARNDFAIEQPYPELLDYEIIFNAASISKKRAPLVTHHSIKNENKRLSVYFDVSSDKENNYLFPFADEITTILQPTYELATNKSPIVIVSIDNLPSILPKESSDNFSAVLLPYLLQLLTLGPHVKNSVWKYAENIFNFKLMKIIKR